MNRALSWQHRGPSLVAIRWRSRGAAPTSRAIAVAVMLMAAAAAGAFVVISPVVRLVACVATVATVAITSASAHFEIVAAGGLLVCRNSGELEPSKSAYLAWVRVDTALPVAVAAGLAVLGPPGFGLPRTICFIGIALPAAAGLGTTARHWSPKLSATRRPLGFKAIGGGLLLFVLSYRLASGLDSRIGHSL